MIHFVLIGLACYLLGEILNEPGTDGKSDDSPSGNHPSEQGPVHSGTSGVGVNDIPEPTGENKSGAAGDSPSGNLPSEQIRVFGPGETEGLNNVP